MPLKKYIKETVKYLLRCPFVIRKERREVERLYMMSEEDLKGRNNDIFLSILHNAYEKSPFYKKLYDEAGIDICEIKSIDDISKLPIVTKDMVKKHGAEILTVPRNKVIEGHTSGTTGTPLRFFKTWDAIHLDQAFIDVSRAKLGCKPNDRLASLRGHLSKKEMFMKVHISNTLYLSSYNISKNTVKNYHKKLLKFKSKAIEGYPSSLYSLALLMRDMNLKLTIPLIFTSSETLFPYQRKIIEEQLGGEIYDLYGMSEQVVYLMEKKDHDGYYIMPGYSIVEIANDGIICTSLINKSFPLIRYKTSDIIEVEKNRDNKDSSPKIKGIQGRTDDFVIAKDGSRLTRIDFIEEAHNIKATQWIQREQGRLEIRLVPEDNFSNKDLEFVLKKMEERIGKNNMEITVTKCGVKDFEYTKAGKFKLIVNLINEHSH